MFISDVLRIKGSKVAKVLPTDDVRTAIRKLADLRIGAVIVENQWQKLVGVFSERDLVKLLAREAKDALDHRIEEVMTKGVITCRSSDRINSALGVMTMNKIRHLPVVDDGALVGIVSIGDLVKHRMDEKEAEAEVLREISRMRA